MTPAAKIPTVWINGMQLPQTVTVRGQNFHAAQGTSIYVSVTTNRDMRRYQEAVPAYGVVEMDLTMGQMRVKSRLGRRGSFEKKSFTRDGHDIVQTRLPLLPLAWRPHIHRDDLPDDGMPYYGSPPETVCSLLGLADWLSQVPEAENPLGLWSLSGRIFHPTPEQFEASGVDPSTHPAFFGLDREMIPLLGPTALFLLLPDDGGVMI